MNKVASFEVDHERLLPGVYVSRRDKLDGGAVVTTFDVRFKRPYREPALSPAVLHTLEHVGAVYLREKSAWARRILYWGPMGCQTGFDLLVAGPAQVAQVVPLVREMCAFIAAFEGEIPGAQQGWECGNYQLHDLPSARREARAFEAVLSRWTPAQSVYPRREK